MPVTLSRVLVAVAFLAAPLRADDRDGIEFFEKRIRPLLADHCYKCHGEKADKVKGNLRLDSKAGWVKGGDSGPSVVANDPDKSPLIQAVRRDHKGIAAMPPDKPLAKEQVADLVAWVKRGAPAPDDGGTVERPQIDIAAAKQRWPFTPLPVKVAVPAVKDASWPASDIDNFLLAKLEEKGLKPVGDADKRVLIRRATFDLIGLPPTPEEIDAFLKDDSPEAFARVIDRLLASPHYGERWGRHWLDVVRYADTAGDNSDYPIPQMFRYRDWVIDAVNRDMPYDQFVREQLAGDLMGGEDETERRRRTVATGYIANARRFGSRVDDYPQHLTIEDTIDNFGRAFLGLTLNCARCHDHKFDPLTMQDYYALYGFFASTRYPWPGIELEKRQRDLVPLVAKEEAEKVFAARREEEKKFDAEIKALEKEKKDATEKAKKDEIGKKIEAKRKQKEKFQQSPLPFAQAYAVAEGKKVGDAAIQYKGDPEKPGDKSPRRFISVLGGQPLPADEKTSGRKHLADWIASPANPLTARVMANRLWHYHFHRGLVATPNDFGKQGTKPTHPELLDYLAREFIERGWSLKAMHKEIMLTRAYRLASVGEVDGASLKDANNELLWKFRRHRLDAESIRDSFLAVSGTLDRTPGGPHPFPDPTKWDFTQHKPFRAVYDHTKRSVYLMTQRIARHPYLAIFDGADTGASTASRVTSTTTLQSLYLLNDPFVHDQAKAFAARIAAARSDDRDRVQWAYRTALGRAATPAETDRAVAFVKEVSEAAKPEAAWESFARTLFRLNEFVYVE
jgi:mono/diheme cytochrome c family protein